MYVYIYIYIYTHTHIHITRYIGEDRTLIELGDGDFFGESAFVITLRLMSTAGGNLTVDEACTARRKGTVLAVPRERETEREREREKEKRERERESERER